MPRVAPDSYDVVVWLLNESTTPFANTSTSAQSLGTAANLTNKVGTVETGQLSLFGQSCPYFPAFGNFPTGASSTHNRLETAGGAGQDLGPPISISGWIKVRSWYNLGDNYGFMFMKRYTNDTTWNAPYTVMDFTIWNTTDGTWRFGLTTAKAYGTGSVGTGGNVLTDTTANFLGGFNPVSNGDSLVIHTGVSAGTYTVSSATATTITITTTFPNANPSAAYSVATTQNQPLVTHTDFPIPEGIWSHIGWTYDGHTLSAYLNGMLAGTFSVSGILDNWNHGPWAFGAAPEGDGNKQEAAFSCCDFRIANTVRPLSYFQNIYRNGVLAF